MDAAGQDVDREQRRAVVRISLGVGLATGAVRRLVRGGCGHLRLLGAADLRAVALVFTGASQFALVGVVASGGSPMAGAASALLLGSRHTLYGLRLATTLRLAGWRRLAGAHLVIDESAAMAVAQPRDQQARVGFSPPAARCSCCGTPPPSPARWVVRRSATPARTGWTRPWAPPSWRCSGPGGPAAGSWRPRWSPSRSRSGWYRSRRPAYPCSRPGRSRCCWG